MVRATYQDIPVIATMRRHRLFDYEGQVLLVGYAGETEKKSFFSPFGMPYAAATCVDGQTYTMFCVPYSKKVGGNDGGMLGMRPWQLIDLHMPVIVTTDSRTIRELGLSHEGAIMGMLPALEEKNREVCRITKAGVQHEQLVMAVRLVDLTYRLQENLGYRKTKS